MDMTTFGFEADTFAILIVGVTTVVMLAVLTAVARRRQSYWWLSIAFVIVSCASLALGSFFSVRIFMGVFEDMSRVGGGISAVWLGIWQATQPTLAAAWLAILIALLASVFVLPRARKELTSMAGARRPHAAIFASLAVLALVVGVTPALLFRRAVTFVLWAITPSAHVSSVSQTIATRLLVTATVSACCFLILIALVVMTVLLARRSSPSRLLFVITVFALVASLGLSAALVVNLRSFSNRFRVAALTGQMSAE